MLRDTTSTYTAPWREEMESRISIMIGGDVDAVGFNKKIAGNSKAYAYTPNNIELFGLPIENTSQQWCSSIPPNFNCSDDKPLWWLVLRWTKIMLFKIAHSYHVKPLILVACPLFIGLVIGFLFGRRYYSEPKKKEKSRSTPHVGFFSKIVNFVCGTWFRVNPNSISSVRSDNIVVASKKKEHRQDDDIVNNSMSTIQKSNKVIETDLETREATTRQFMRSNEGMTRESGVPADRVPRHVAVIMDGNRRYGKQTYGNATRGHWDGSSKLVEFAKWCIAEQISVLTVFAFSSENWKRGPNEIAALMKIFAKYCDELRVEAIKRNIKIVTLSTDFNKVSDKIMKLYHEVLLSFYLTHHLFFSCTIIFLLLPHQKIPPHVQLGVKRMVEDTKHCDGMIMNICLSYGSRDEIVMATKSVVEDVLKKKVDPNSIDDSTISQKLLTYNCGGDPDILIRTSGEMRISNFLLWQLAYTELFFIDKPWPAIEKADLIQVIRAYVDGRNRRYGK